MSIIDRVRTLPRHPVVPQEAFDKAAILEGAAEQIERHGWASNGQSYPAKCAVMAIAASYVASNIPDAWIAYRAADSLAEFLGVDPGCVPQWNDAQASGDVVCDALRACAVAVRSGLL